MLVRGSRVGIIGGSVNERSLQLNIPYKDLTLVLKQVNHSQIGADERKVLNFFAAGFLNPGDKPADVDPEAPFATFTKRGFDTFIDNSVQRRFAGDGTLPRSRYFTVCRHDNGDDGGTLINELKAYWNPQKCGYVAIIDTTGTSQEAEHFRRYLIPGTAGIFYVILDSAAFPSPFGSLCGIDRRTNRSQLNGVIPLSITRQTISNVIDLRDPETADWFTRELTRLKSNATGLPVFLAGPLDDFARLLPRLMAQELGSGLGATQMAGLWLRELGANALLFPSARCDLSVEVVDGEVVDYYGWNLVDYRNAPEPTFGIGADVSPEWAEDPMVGANSLLGASGGQPFIYRGTTIHRETEGLRHGSLTVGQLEEQRQCMEFIITWNYFVDQMRPAIGDEDAEKLISILAEAATTPGGLLRTKVAIGLCNLFVSAAIGDEEAHLETLRLAKVSEEKGDVPTARAFYRFLAIADRK